VSLKATTLVWERSRAKGSNLMMLLAISDYSKDDGRFAWPSPATLAFKTRLTQRGAELILKKLVKDGEVLPELEKDGRFYLHLRCVCDWPAYQAEGEIPEREKFSRKVKRSFAEKLCRLAAKRAHGAAPYAKTAADSASVPLLIRQEPSVDPSKEPSEEKAGAVPRSFLAGENLTVITKLAHGMLDVLGLPKDAELTEYAADLKQRCADVGLAYDSTVVWKALESAIWQRQHRRRA
jgi:hypothetical protein